MFYKTLLRPILFSLRGGDAEAAHEQTIALLALVGGSRALSGLLARLYGYHHPNLERRVFGVRFPNPLGLAAGMDKDGQALPAWAGLGFGFVEVGTVTWQAQTGNPRPRLFRLPADAALINRMGFNNRGASALAAQLAKLRSLSIPLGVSIGKSKATPLEAAVDDYRASFSALFEHAAYVAINVSSPNTPGLRALQDSAQLDTLLAALQRENQLLANQRGVPERPLLVKIAPDLGEPALAELLDICLAHRISGIVATNTTISRAGLRANAKLVAQTGGLSGQPLTERALDVVRFVVRESGGQLPVIGVGGVAGPEQACRMLDAGAVLLQLYTGLIYEGPGLPRRIKRALALR